MRVYPKGCKVYALGVSGEVLGAQKFKHKRYLGFELWQAAGGRGIQKGAGLLIQPRGRRKWWGFRYTHMTFDPWDEWEFVMSSESKEAVQMALLLQS